MCNCVHKCDNCPSANLDLVQEQFTELVDKLMFEDGLSWSEALHIAQLSIAPAESANQMFRC